jgi:hypothetical protein
MRGAHFPWHMLSEEFQVPMIQERSSNAETIPLDGAEYGRRMHVPAGPISSDWNAIDSAPSPNP